MKGEEGRASVDVGALYRFVILSLFKLVILTQPSRAMTNLFTAARWTLA